MRLIIVRFLNFRSVVVISAVSRRWHKLSQDGQVWCYIFKRDFPVHFQIEISFKYRYIFVCACCYLSLSLVKKRKQRNKDFCLIGTNLTKLHSFYNTQNAPLCALI